MTTRMDTEQRPDILLSTDDIVKIIPLSKETIIAYIKNGELEGFYVGRRYFAYRSKVYEFLAKHTVGKETNSLHDNTYYNPPVHKGKAEP